MPESKKPGGQPEKKRLIGDIVLDVKNPALEAAKKRAEQLIQEALAGNPTAIVVKLMSEVRHMTFDPTLTEPTKVEHERRQLLLHLQKIEDELIGATKRLGPVILAMEAARIKEIEEKKED